MSLAAITVFLSLTGHFPSGPAWLIPVEFVSVSRRTDSSASGVELAVWPRVARSHSLRDLYGIERLMVGKFDKMLLLFH